MTQILILSDAPSGLRIEVEDGATAGARPSLDGLIQGLGALAAQTGAVVAQLEEGERPTELSLEFGVRALASGHYAITLDPEAANFQVTLSWRQEPAAVVSDLLPEPG